MPSQYTTILIVEDDPGFGRFLMRVIQRMGFISFLVTNISQARRLLTRNEVHLILLDRILGGGQDGVNYCLELKKNPQTHFIPVIILTGLQDVQEEFKGYQHGADLYLQKPLPLGTLMKYILAFLKRPTHRGRRDHASLKRRRSS